jgi:hypothetical protein
MKKASKPPAKKAAQNKPATKKPRTTPKRKAEEHSELAEIVARLAVISENLTQTTERLAQIALPAGPTPSSPQPPEAPLPHTDEHVDDIEVASTETGDE